MFKLILWLCLAALIVSVGGQTVMAYYNNVKIENTFQGAASNLGNSAEGDIRRSLNKLLIVQSVDVASLPKKFFKNLRIVKSENRIMISSKYTVNIWPIGKPSSVDNDMEMDEKESELMLFVNEWRAKMRFDIQFAPMAHHP